MKFKVSKSCLIFGGLVWVYFNLTKFGEVDETDH
jgi:hypothetical protein